MKLRVYHRGNGVAQLNHRRQLFQHILPLEEIDLDEFIELIIIMWENLEFNKHIEFAMA